MMDVRIVNAEGMKQVQICRLPASMEDTQIIVQD